MLSAMKTLSVYVPKNDSRLHGYLHKSHWQIQAVMTLFNHNGEQTVMLDAQLE